MSWDYLSIVAAWYLMAPRPIAGLGSAVLLIGAAFLLARFVPVRAQTRTTEGSLSKAEVHFYKSVEGYIRTMRSYDRLLELQRADEQFCVAVFKVYKAGYQAGQLPKVVGALTMEAVKRYQPNRELAILFLRALEKRFVPPAQPGA